MAYTNINTLKFNNTTVNSVYYNNSLVYARCCYTSYPFKCSMSCICMSIKGGCARSYTCNSVSFYHIYTTSICQCIFATLTFLRYDGPVGVAKDFCFTLSYGTNICGSMLIRGCNGSICAGQYTTCIPLACYGTATDSITDVGGSGASFIGILINNCCADICPLATGVAICYPITCINCRDILLACAYGTDESICLQCIGMEFCAYTPFTYIYICKA